MRDFAGLSGFNNQPHFVADALANEVMVNCACGQ